MKNLERIQRMEELLTKALNPTYLMIEDDSHQHIGHIGAENGAGHYRLIVAAPQFAGQSQLDCHRLIYQVLDEMMGPEIHALQIKIIHSQPSN